MQVSFRQRCCLAPREGKSVAIAALLQSQLRNDLETPQACINKPSEQKSALIKDGKAWLAESVPSRFSGGRRARVNIIFAMSAVMAIL